MLTRRKRIGIDSSPKTSISKNAHLLTKKTMQDSANMLSTPPTRRNRFMLGNNNANVINDDSPVLSQETINIAWKWKSDTPNRPTNKTSKLKRSITNASAAQISSLQRLNRNSYDNQTATTSSSSGISPMLVAEPETHSPKGLYKFQEEMRKIQFDTESNTVCDNNYNDKSKAESDTGYPNKVGAADANNAGCSDSLDVSMLDENVELPRMTSTQNCIGENLADDLLNDSDFDHILLTCKMPAQTTDSYGQIVSESNKSFVKKASSAPEIKANGSGSTSSGSNWNMIDDFDDLVKDIDFDEDITLNTSAKFTRHKSMPQQPQKPNTLSSKTPKKFMPQQSKKVDNYQNRKTFTRHESMPITNQFINPPANNNIISAKQKSELSSTQERKCTKEEIAEKRRQAIERLKNRQKHVKVST